MKTKISTTNPTEEADDLIESLLDVSVSPGFQDLPVEHFYNKPNLQTRGFGTSVLARAQADLGVREDLGKNDGRRIRQYFSYFGSGAGQDWCAAAVSAWMKEAGGGPISGAMGALNTMAQFKSAGLFVLKKDLTSDDLLPGNIPIWHRGPTDSGKGHIGVIESYDGRGTMITIEGNSGVKGNAVVRMSRSINDPNLIGVGILSYSSNQKKSLNNKIDNIVSLANMFYRMEIMVDYISSVQFR